MKIAIGSDHAGYALKEEIKKTLDDRFEIEDFGTYSEDSCDYPDIAHPLAKSIIEGKNSLGIAICGSGNGINMTLNKYPEIRSALCWNEELAKLSREHNNANILALPSRFIGVDEAKKCVNVFLSTSFEGGRHERRVDKIKIKK